MTNIWFKKKSILMLIGVLILVIALNSCAPAADAPTEAPDAGPMRSIS